MYQKSDLRKPESARQRLSKVATYTLLCVALAGLIAGFAIGSFAEHNHNSATASLIASQLHKPSTIPHTPSATPVLSLENIQPDDPILRPGDFTTSEVADGTTSYRVSAQITDKSTGKSINATDVTCRLWLTQDTNATQSALNANDYALPKTISALSQPFPAEMQGALNFTGNSLQVQPCAAGGKTAWTYTLSPALTRGTYFLAILADWKGIHYNWYLVQITIQQTQQ